MPVHVDADDLAVTVENLSRDIAMEAANRWFSWSQEIFTEGGDQEGYDIFPVVQSARPPEWTEDGAEFVYPHEATQFFEKGTTAHEIEANQGDVLAFEWEDAPAEVRDMFEETFPTVFFPSVTVDGIERIGGIERGRQRTVQWLESQ